jgi:Sulfotransferase domain
MKLIGAGLPRTGTLSQKIALEMLGLAPCYHMVNVLTDLEETARWRRAVDGDLSPAEIFEGFEATVDWPGSFFYRELIELYPDAKVLLSVRSPESWVESMNNTISQIFVGDSLLHHLARAQYHVDPLYKDWLDLLSDMWDASGVTVGGDDQKMATTMEEWNQAVIDGVPADRLLVWHPKDGWEPLCELLEMDVPEAPLPNVNDTENFRKNLIMGPAVEAINDWWESNKGPEDAATAQRDATASPAT